MRTGGETDRDATADVMEGKLHPEDIFGKTALHTQSAVKMRAGGGPAAGSCLWSTSICSASFFYDVSIEEH